MFKIYFSALVADVNYYKVFHDKFFELYVSLATNINIFIQVFRIKNC